jgi:hypothetical protein
VKKRQVLKLLKEIETRKSPSGEMIIEPQKFACPSLEPDRQSLFSNSSRKKDVPFLFNPPLNTREAQFLSLYGCHH